MWEWKGKALDEGEYAADWLSEYLDKPVRLLRYAGPLASSAAGCKAFAKFTLHGSLGLLRIVCSCLVRWA